MRFEQACSRLRKSGKIDDKFFELIKDVQPNRTKLFLTRSEDQIRLVRGDFRRYVVSFSEDPTHWRCGITTPREIAMRDEHRNRYRLDEGIPGFHLELRRVSGGANSESRLQRGGTDKHHRKGYPGFERALRTQIRIIGGILHRNPSLQS